MQRAEQSGDWRTFAIAVAGKHLTAKTRKLQTEDCVAAWRAESGWILLAVADGMGFYSRASEASHLLVSLAVQNAVKLSSTLTAESFHAVDATARTIFDSVVHEAQVVANGDENFQSTFALCCISPDGRSIAAVSLGDSFLGIEYCEPDSHTAGDDHSVLQYPCLMGGQRARGDNATTSAFGPGVEPEMCTVFAEGIRGVALFTDGLETYVGDYSGRPSGAPKELDSKLFGDAFSMVRKSKNGDVANGFSKLASRKDDDIGIAMASRL